MADRPPANEAGTALITDHAFKVAAGHPCWELCAICRLAESAHLASVTPYVPKGANDG